MRQTQRFRKITAEIPGRLFPGVTYLVILLLAILISPLPLAQENKINIYLLALASLLSSSFYFQFLSQKIPGVGKYYFAYLGEIIGITLFLFFVGEFRQLFFFLFYLPLIAVSLTLSPKHIFWVAGLTSVAITILGLVTHFSTLTPQGFFFTLFLLLFSLWLVAFFARFTAEKVLKEQSTSFQTTKKLLRAQIQTQKTEEFFTFISHELKNSLAVVLAHLERVLSGKAGRLPREARSSLNEAFEASSETQRMIQNILATTRLEVGKIKMNRKSIHLSKIILESIDHLRPQYEKAGLYLRYQVENPLPKVLGDPEKIEEVCLNLLLNAQTFTKRGGVEISHRLSPGYLWTVIKDTGIGIPKKDLPYIFKKFRSFAQEEYPGLGLGLYISAQYLKLMGGKIWCESRQNQGSTFYFRLPLAKKY